LLASFAKTNTKTACLGTVWINIHTKKNMIIKEILNRRSVREYKTDPVPEEKIVEIIKAGQFAPSARNIRALDFIIVKDQKTKEDIFKIVGQEFVKEAPVLIVPICDTSKTDFSIQDLSAASENMFLQATCLGLGTVWKNIRPEWEEGVKKIIGIPKQYKAMNIIPLGYAKSKPEPYTDNNFDNKKLHYEFFKK
jgi:nitroreductase